MDEKTNDPFFSIPSFYSGRSIFITGASGFMGKVLVEKLLRSCPGIKEIFLLMRPKKNLNMHERLQHVLSNPVISAGVIADLARYCFNHVRIAYFSYSINCDRNNPSASTN